MSEDLIQVWSLNEKQSLRFESEGSLYYLSAKPRQADTAPVEHEAGMVLIQKSDKVDINSAHVLLGHIGRVLLDKTAKMIGWQLSGTLTTCKACARAKVVATRVPSTATEQAVKPAREFLSI